MGTCPMRCSNPAWPNINKFVLIFLVKFWVFRYTAQMWGWEIHLSLPNFIFVLRKIGLNLNLGQKGMNQHPTKNELNKPKSAEILVGNSMLHSMSLKTLPILLIL